MSVEPGVWHPTEGPTVTIEHIRKVLTSCIEKQDEKVSEIESLRSDLLAQVKQLVHQQVRDEMVAEVVTLRTSIEEEVRRRFEFFGERIDAGAKQIDVVSLHVQEIQSTFCQDLTAVAQQVTKLQEIGFDDLDKMKTRIDMLEQEAKSFSKARQLAVDLDAASDCIWGLAQEIQRANDRLLDKLNTDGNCCGMRMEAMDTLERVTQLVAQTQQEWIKLAPAENLTPEEEKAPLMASLDALQKTLLPLTDLATRKRAPCFAFRGNSGDDASGLADVSATLAQVGPYVDYEESLSETLCHGSYVLGAVVTD